MRVLVACEFSGIVRDAFTAKGHDAISCDLLPTERSGPHIQGDVRELNLQQFDLIIAHPPCTYLAHSGIQWLTKTPLNPAAGKLYGPSRWEAMLDGCKLFNFFLQSGIPKIAVENPIPHRHAIELIGPYSQTIQPWQFGHPKQKRTCLWLRNLPNLRPTTVVGPPPKDQTRQEKMEWQEVHYTRPGVDQWKLRSITYQGIADAMAEQWGG